MSSLYRPFIDDPNHLRLVEGQRYVVLRATGGLATVFVDIQRRVKRELAGAGASYPAGPHLTLLGLGPGTELSAVRALVGAWAHGVPPLDLEVEEVSTFPSPFQILILRIRKTQRLVAAMAGLRELARERGLADAGRIATSDWVFHLSVAYCASLDAPSWAAASQSFQAQAAPAAMAVAREAEIVAFDAGQESSGGVVPFGGAE